MASPDFEAFRREQERLRTRVRVEPLDSSPELIAALDVHFPKRAQGVAAVVLLTAEGELIEEHVATGTIDVPYVAGFLSFRELPLGIEAFSKLQSRPDLLLVDGQGLAHPRRFGLACHLGVELDLPTIGVAKSKLVGKGSEPADHRGAVELLYDPGEVVGATVRTRDRVRPVYVSVGHRVTLDEAIELTLEQSRGYRLPEPNRLAHRLAQRSAAELRSRNG